MNSELTGRLADIGAQAFDHVHTATTLLATPADLPQPQIKFSYVLLHKKSMGESLESVDPYSWMTVTLAGGGVTIVKTHPHYGPEYRHRIAELTRTDRTPGVMARLSSTAWPWSAAYAGTILEICAATRPDLVQLHGDESEAVVKDVAAALADIC